MQFEDIANAVLAYHPKPDLSVLEKAYNFAKKVHEGQVRASGEPYFTHLHETALIVCRLRLDIPSVVAALLHDSVEDCDVTRQDVEDSFGSDVANIVEGVTKLTKLGFESREEKQAESFRKMLLAMAKDIRVVIVKLCDRLHNMRTLEHMSEEKQRLKALETKDIYAPLANRLGLHWLKSELEDLCFLYIRPELYQRVKEKFDQSESQRDEFIKDTTEQILSLLQKSGVSASVKGRSKHLYSIWNKMESKNLSFEEIYDILGFRVVVPTIRACYEVLGIVHAAWKPVPGRFKDYVAMPKPNMYQSLHTTVIGPSGKRIEIQIRTPDMNKVAEEGVAAHWQYKEGGASKGFDLHWVTELVESQQYLKNPDEFIQSVKGELFPDEVFIFTPKGDLIRLTEGSTPVDFAYAIHTDIGNTVSGARVNGSIVPLSHKLSNGDTVEVMTSKNQVPSKDWIYFVKSSKAKQKIRAFVRSKEHANAMAVGVELLTKDLKKLKLGIKKLEKSGEMQKAAESLNFKELGGLYADIGYGKLSTTRVISKIAPDSVNVEEKLNREPTALQRLFQKAAKSSRSKVGVQVSGLNDIVLRFAKCCEPLPGERIIGFITRGRGVTVHHVNCAHILSCDPQRLVQVDWDSQVDTKRRVNLKVHSQDQIGLLADVTNQITVQGGDIKTASIETTKFGKAVISFELEVKDSRQLNSIVRSIERVRGVIRVERVKQISKTVDIDA